MCISVIIPTFNRGYCLAEAIRCLIAQTLRPEEIIVVDDGSTDDTEAVAAAFSGDVRYIRQENLGLPAARNTGLRSATKKYVLFLDSDDLLAYPSTLMEMAAAAEARPDVGAVVSGWSEVNMQDGREMHRFAPPPVEGDLFHRLLMTNIAPVHAFLVRRHIGRLLLRSVSQVI